MKWLTLSNLFPTPSEPLRGLYNLRLFRSLGHRVDVRNVCPVFGWRRRVRQWHCPVPGAPFTTYVPVPYVPVLSRPFNWRLLMMAVRKSVVESGADTVYAAWLYPDGVAAAELARNTGKKCWLMALGSDVGHTAHPQRGTLIVESCNAVEGVLCVAPHLKDELVEAGVRADKVHVVANGVETNLFHPRPKADAVARLKSSGAWPVELAQDAKLAIFVGNIVEVKRPLLLLDAWARYRRQQKDGGTNSALLLLGQGPLMSSVRHEIRRLGQEGCVFALGARPPEEVALWMNAADCLCLCSAQEGMPNVVLEALASGLPVVSTAAGAVPEILKDVANSIVVSETRSEDALADRIAGAIGFCLARAERERAVERAVFWTRSWDDMAGEIIGLIGGKKA